MDGPRPQLVVHNMDSTEIPVYGEQEHSACDGHFESLLSPAGETCALLLVIAGGRTPEPAAVRGDAGLARAVAGSDGIEIRDPVRSAAELSPSSWGQEAKVVQMAQLAWARESLCRGLGSGWFTERFYRNALVTHFQHRQVFCPARRLENHAVTCCGLHQRAPQGGHPADVVAVEIDLVDAYDADYSLSPRGIGI